MKQKIYANVYRNTINDGDSQTSLLPIFSEGGGTSVHRLAEHLHAVSTQKSRYKNSDYSQARWSVPPKIH